MRVAFLYNAQFHQIPHSLPIALELADRHRGIEVSVVGATSRHLDFARRLARCYGIASPLHYRLLDRPWDARLRSWILGRLAPAKKRTLEKSAALLASFDAIVTPERTSLELRRLGLLPAHTRLVYTGHGAGDRAIACAPEIREFDFVFTFGEKLARRRLELGLIRPGAYATGVHAKFDWVHAGPPRAPLFDNGRPTVLYAPHFEPSLSSWPDVGMRVLEHFAASDRLNLVFAPHVRMFEPPRPAKYRQFRRFMGLPHLRIDLGSERSIDMTYTLGADLYLGDVSSQVGEFLMRPRPCLFLNPRRIAWTGDPNYRFWELGPVLEDIDALGSALADTFASHSDYVEKQRAYFAETFTATSGDEPSSRRGADILAAYLRGESLPP